MPEKKWSERMAEAISVDAEAEIQEIERVRDLRIAFAEKMEAIGVIQWLRENIGPRAAVRCAYQFGISEAAKAEEKYQNLVVLVLGLNDDKGNYKANLNLWEAVKKLSKELNLEAHGLKVGRYVYDSYQIAIVPIALEASWWKWEGDES